AYVPSLVQRNSVGKGVTAIANLGDATGSRAGPPEQVIDIEFFLILLINAAGKGVPSGPFGLGLPVSRDIEILPDGSGEVDLALFAAAGGANPVFDLSVEPARGLAHALGVKRVRGLVA